MAAPLAGAAHRTLVVFVKYPRAGAVKTRLVPALAAEDAALLYRALAERVLEATAPRAGEYERLVFYDPPEAAEAMRAWLPAGRLRRQAQGDLGTRLADAFSRAFARGAGRVAVIGSDVPSLGRDDVLAAFQALEDADLVLGPAPDGGFYLVALREPRARLFEGVAWSTSSVMADTLARAASGGLSVRRLDTRRDVDTLEDLREQWGLVQALLGDRPGLLARLARAVSTGPGR